MPSLRETEIFDVVDAFVDYHHAWQGDERRPYPDGSYYDLLLGMVEVCAVGDVPGTCRDIVKAVDRLAEEYQIVRDIPGTLNNEGIVDGVQPHREFWEAVETLEVHRHGPAACPLPKLESVYELDKQKVNHAQICRIYGFIDARGEPQLFKVEEELAAPGTWVNASWVDPRERVHKKAQQDAVQRAQDNLASKRLRSHRQDEKACPETPEELWKQGVSAFQAHLMLKRPLVQVEEMWAKWHREAGTKAAEPVVEPDLQRQAARRPMPQRDDEAGDDIAPGGDGDEIALIHPNAEDLREIVISAARAQPGVKAKELADGLRESGYDVTWQRVNSIMQASKADIEAVDTAAN